MEKRFENKVVVVTGAAQGIGRGVAIALAEEGAIVGLVDRSDLVNEVAQIINDNNGSSHVVMCDMEKFSGAEEFVKEIEANLGKIDIVINNIGGTIWTKPFEYYEADEIEAEIRRSLYPTLWSCRAVLPGMIERKAGVIVNISSIATKGIHRIPYSAAKGGINAITASLAFEYAEYGIRVNAVATGGTEAPPRKIPRNVKPLSEQENTWNQEIVDQTIQSSYMHRYGTIDEQVRAILFLASDESSYITGSILPVAGGDQG
jgi:dihydroxycyclohexadiene carboxylate dehydrogenase